MMELLVRYAQEHGLVTEPGFAPKTIRWAIVLDDKGKLLDVIELGDMESKGNPGQTFERCPEFSPSEIKRGSTKRSHFLWEAANVVALYGKSESDQKTLEKHSYFIHLLREAGTVMPGLSVAASTLSNDLSLVAIRDLLSNAKARATEKVTFRISGAFPLESDAWHDWWRDFRKKNALKDEKERKRIRCFATGDLVEPALTHLTIQGLAIVGGRPQGDVLVSFDKDSFESYGFKKSANASISEESASAYRATLNHLIKRHGQQLAGAKVIHWFKKQIEKTDDPMSWLEEGQGQQELNAQEQARRMLNRIRTGERVDLQDNHFYAITLSGAKGRVMIRDWMEGRLENLVDNVAKWFEDISIVNLSGSNLAKSPGIERVITCILPPRKPAQQYKDWIKPIGADRAGLWAAAVRDQAIPRCAIFRIVVLHGNFMFSGILEEILAGQNRNDSALQLSLLYARMGLIKAFHLRSERVTGGNAMAEVIKPDLNKGYPNPAYQCGRLMAILARLQQSALGDVGAGVIQRYYASASSTPSLVIGRLTRNSQYHLNKLSPGLAHWYEEELANVWYRLKDGVPKSLNLEEQSLFALGYYQQIAEMRKKKEDSPESVKEDQNE
ncbi:MAG: type I-C CRISPR-associated protein Cas8c/Csd1 [Actinomycetota bacterium]|nr:type I-C CRISPR-associated protein Cas8c/Csd1 [Actinomycetota bacterium]